jgi:hypothetical protein
MNWKDILFKGKKQNHHVGVHRICNDARRRLEELGLSDVDKLVSLRVGATERIWGILDQGCLKILWWDPTHAICPSLPR